MIKRKTIHTPAALAIALALVAVEFSTAAAEPLGRIGRGKSLIGKDVRTQDNSRVGEIEDVVVDLTAGRILYVVVNTADGDVAVPAALFRDVRGNRVQLAVDQEQVKDAPEFTSAVASPERIKDAGFVDRVYKHFNQNAWWRGSRPTDEGSFTNVRRLSTLPGTEVRDVNNAVVATVKNLGLDLRANRVAFVVIEPVKNLELGEDWFPMPPDAFTPNPDAKALTSNISREKLANAPKLSNSEWSRLSDERWASRVYQHFGKQPYFSPTRASQVEPTGRETPRVYQGSDRDALPPSSVNRSENEDDYYGDETDSRRRR